MKKPMKKMLLYVGIFFAVVFGIYGAKKVIFLWFMSHYQPPPTTISATTATTKPWQSYVTAVGTLKAINGVDLTAEVPGTIESIQFNSGQYIHKGTPIITLQANVERANLKHQEAVLRLAQLNYDREKTLFAKNVTSKASLDARNAELLQAQANVESIQAQLQQKTIVAPFDGRLGIRSINVGQYVSPGTALVTLQSLDPLYVEFTLPEQYLADLALGEKIDVNVNIGAGKRVSGQITAINSKVDPNTRNVAIQATIKNEKYALYPGMYGYVSVWLNNRSNAVIVPQTAISYSLNGDFVYLVKDESSKKDGSELHAYKQYVKIGERRGDIAVIADGVKNGDRIVTSGQLKLHQGSIVLIDNSVEL